MRTTDCDPVAAAFMPERELVITRVFDAPRELVFRAWTEPDRAVRWWGPQGFTTAYREMDLQPGGAYRVCMRSPEGTEHWQRGVCREVVEPERLVFTFAWEDAEGRPGHETVVTVTFAEHGAKTKLTLHQAVLRRSRRAICTRVAGRVPWIAWPSIWRRAEMPHGLFTRGRDHAASDRIARRMARRAQTAPGKGKAIDPAARSARR